MDIFAKLPFLGKSQAEHETPIEEARERARALKHGSQKFRTVTTGQVRRFEDRGRKRMARKARRKQIRAYFAGQREAMALRGHLQAAGVIAYVNRGYEPTPRQVYLSIIWLTERFTAVPEGETVEVTFDVIKVALQSALNRFESIVGLPMSKLPEDYELPSGVTVA